MIRFELTGRWRIGADLAEFRIYDMSVAAGLRFIEIFKFVYVNIYIIKLNNSQ